MNQKILYTMKNKNYMKELNEIGSFLDKIRNRKLNENISFEDDADLDSLLDNNAEQPTQDVPTEQDPVTNTEQQPTGEEPVEEPDQCADGECNLDKKSSEEIGMEELDNMGEVDQIRKITLDGMRKLAEHPEDPKFQALLKIFQICNKSVDTKEEQQGEK